MSEEPRLSPDEPRIIDAPESWLEQNRLALLIGVLVLVAVASGAAFVWERRAARDAAAEALFFDAKTSDAWKAIADQHAGTSSAPLALLQLARQAREDGKLDDSLAALDRYLKEYPKHSFRGAAEFSRAMVLEALGRGDEARSAYEAIRTARPDHTMKGAASVALARMLIAKGDTTVARQVLSDFVATQRESGFTAEANRLLRSLPSSSPTSGGSISAGAP